MPGQQDSDPTTPGRPLRAVAGALALVAVAAAIAVGALLLTGVIGGSDEEVAPAEIAEDVRSGGERDPFTWSPARSEDLARRGAAGNAHVLYEKSPGGIVASAARTARWRDEIEAAADAHGADPDVMEAMVLLESAGRPQVIAGDDPEVASGLSQIVASTGIDLLGMDIDLPRSQAITKQIARTPALAAKLEQRATKLKGKERRRAIAKARKVANRVPALTRERAEIDPRFDPEAALDGMGTYLEIASERFGREDLAVASYHMGIGNLETVIDRYLSPGDTSGPTDELVAANDLDYTRLFFDSSPLENPRTWAFLGSLGDDSSTYLWRVAAAERIMELYRDDRDRLGELADLHTAKATAEEVFHPASETKVYADPDEIQSALDDGELVEIPSGRDYGFEVGPQLGQLAKRLEVDRDLYAALRPEALAVLTYIGANVREIEGGRGVLTVTSAVRDETYQDALTGINVQATPAYSLHTTGYSFDILRKYRGDGQAQAFQFMLDRLRSLEVIDYAVEPEAIHVTVSDEAEALLEE